MRYSEAEAELAALAEALGLPVVETFAGKGAVQQDAWYGLGGVGLEGNPAANALAAEADLVLAVGTRLTDFTTGSQLALRSIPRRAVRRRSTSWIADARKLGATPVVGDAQARALTALRGGDPRDAAA